MEFFFGGCPIIVEGDTEYTAFNYIKSVKPEEYRNIHIIRARGKATIVSLMKILNQFGMNYSVLHDSDKPTFLTRDGKEKANPAWTTNRNILNESNAAVEGATIRLIASITNFEKAFLEEEVKYDKPYNILINLRQDDKIFLNVEQLLNALIHFDANPPSNCLEWDCIEDLESALP